VDVAVRGPDWKYNRSAGCGALANGPDKVYTRDMGGAMALVVGVFGAMFLASLAFWIWMLIDCATEEPSTGNTKICWVLIIVFATFVGALIYYFVRRPQRYAEIGH